MTRWAPFLLIALATCVSAEPAVARDVCLPPLVAKGKPSALRPQAEALAVTAWNTAAGSGSPFTWDGAQTQRKALTCTTKAGRITCEAAAIPCAAASYDACEGAFAGDGPAGRDYCGEAGDASARVWLVTCGTGYALKARNGPDQCEIEPRWVRR